MDFTIDCHDREVPAWTASPRPLTGTDIRTLMDKALWARFGETMTTAPLRFNGSPTTPPVHGDEVGALRP